MGLANAYEIDWILDTFDTTAGLFSSGLGAHLSWTLPFGLLIMFAVFNRFDPAYEEAARDLGATPWQTIRHVVLPMIAPSLVGVALFGFTLSWDELPAPARPWARPIRFPSNCSADDDGHHAGDLCARHRDDGDIAPRHRDGARRPSSPFSAAVAATEAMRARASSGMTRVLVVNPNSTVSMTDKIAEAARAVAAVGTDIVARTSRSGPPAIQGPEDGRAALPGLFAEIGSRRATKHSTPSSSPASTIPGFMRRAA